MSRAIDELLHDHEAVLLALEVLERMTERPDQVPPGDPAEMVGFLKVFADECHHGKEEGTLFPALVAAGMPQEGGPVGVMLSEHIQGRELIRRMEAASRPPLDAPAFAVAARQYAMLMRAHIEKENGVLFPIAERMLPPAELDRISQAFGRHEAEVIGEARHEQLHALLQRLHDRYGG